MNIQNKSTAWSQVSHSCFRELLALVPGLSLEPRCHLPELPTLALAWAEGPSSEHKQEGKQVEFQSKII